MLRTAVPHLRSPPPIHGTSAGAAGPCNQRLNQAEPVPWCGPATIAGTGLLPRKLDSPDRRDPPPTLATRWYVT